MDPISRYIGLIAEIEQKLGRKVTDEEESFIRWIVEQEIFEHARHLNAGFCG